MNINLNLLFFLGPMVFLAGFIDSIAGGGGLISLSSYMVCGLPATVCLGTNKFSAFIGSTVASVNYIRTKNFDLKTLLPASAFAIAGSFIGSECAMFINERVFSIILLVVTPLIAILVAIDKNYNSHEKEMNLVSALVISGFIGLIVGFYDGFYGPGTGTFLQLGFIMFSGIGLKKSCGNARIVNWASNCGALVNFIRTGNVVYALALPCAVCSILGNYIGSSLAIKKDVKIVKPVMLIVVSLLFVKILVGMF